ncbi:MAG TPA: ATP-binding cassette domain-containing protein [Chryseolinea sp.]|nr:ATP-binding cassette domain-containing protein [Chryseolinea sp.]
MSHAILFEDVVFRYHPQSQPLRLNVALADGQVTAVVGLSGSGKSTLLQLINGMVRPEKGSVSVLGHPIDYTRLQDLRRKVGYMVQGAGLFPHLTIEKNIGIASRIMHEPVSEERINDLMEQMGLPRSYRQRHPYQLSGGEQQRAAICMALYARPPVLLMDESLSSLDAITRVEVQGQLLALQEHEHCTVVLVTHDMQEALRLGDQLLVLNDGSVQAFGSLQEVRSSPNEHVQKLFAYATQMKPKSTRP